MKPFKKFIGLFLKILSVPSLIGVIALLAFILAVGKCNAQFTTVRGCALVVKNERLDSTFFECDCINIGGADIINGTPDFKKIVGDAFIGVDSSFYLISWITIDNEIFLRYFREKIPVVEFKTIRYAYDCRKNKFRILKNENKTYLMSKK